MKTILEYVINQKIKPQKEPIIFSDNEIENMHKRALRYTHVVIGIWDDNDTRNEWKQNPLSYRKQIINDLVHFLDDIDIENQNITKLLYYYDNSDGSDEFLIYCNAVPGKTVGYFRYLGDAHTFSLTTFQTPLCGKKFKGVKIVNDETDINEIKNIMLSIHK